MKIDTPVNRVYKNLKNNQLRTIFALFVTCSSLLMLRNLYFGFEARIRAGYLDTAGMMDLIKVENVRTAFRSDYLAGAYGGLISLITSTNDAICNVAQNIDTSGQSNIFQKHSYLMSWPLSVLNYISPFSSLQIVAAVVLLSYVSVFVTTYLFLTKAGVRLITRIATLFAVTTYPVFAVAFTGQPFFDHLMIGLALPLIYLVWWTKYRSIKVYKWIVALTVLLAMTTERGAALAGLVSIGYIILLHGTGSLKIRELRYILLSGLLSSIWFIVWIKFFQSYGAYGQISITGMLSRFNALFQAPLSSSAFVFFSTSIFWIVLNLFAGRYLAVSILAVLPNLLISIGGAELTGFLTHYHQGYAAVLIAGGVIGVVHFELRVRRIKDTKISNFVLPSVCILFLTLSAFVYRIPSVEMASGKGWTSVEQIWFPGKSSIQEAAKMRADFLEKSVLEISEYRVGAISAPEIFGPALLNGGFKDYEYWPTSVGHALFVIAPFNQDGPVVYPFGDFYGTGPTLTECISGELEKSYTLLNVLKHDSLGEYRFYVKN